MEPGSRQPAPPPLRLVQEFVNTRDIMERTDALLSRAGLHAWAVDRDLLAAGDVLRAEDHQRTLEVREAVRALLLANNEGAATDGDLASLRAAAGVAELTLVFDSPVDPPRLVAAAGGIDGALGTILLAIYDASCSGVWGRLKACREPTCRWAFYDHSRNRRSHWCTMSMCGGRAKARAYRERQRGGAPPDGAAASGGSRQSSAARRSRPAGAPG
jgi:predicted RNA-binding Zn ribbon-like protein